MTLLIWIKEAIANNPERIKSWLVAAGMLFAYYFPELTADRDIWLQFAGATLFGGELVRQAVTPTCKLNGLSKHQPATDAGQVPSSFLIGFLLGGLTVCVYLLITGRL